MARKSKRMGKENAPTRLALLEATEKLLQREGYPSVVGRKVAEEAGINRELLYYYFSDMDELVIEVFEKYCTDFNSKIETAFLDENPLQALWKLYIGGNARLFMEFTAMANQNEVLREKFTKAAVHQEAILKEGFSKLLDANRVDPSVFPLEVVSFLFEAAMRNYLIQNELGFFTCGDKLDAFIERCSEYLKPTYALE